jgi:Protein of unknown function (DUF3443)
VRSAWLPVLLAGLSALTGCFKLGPEVTQSPISISLSTNNSSVGIGQSAIVTAIVYDQSSQGVAWTASPLNFGTLSNQTFDPSTLTATVTYTAPSIVANPTKVTVTATSITNPNIVASLSFKFSPIIISLQNNSTGTPLAPLTLSPGDQLYLFSDVSNDISNLGVTWSISPATGAGSIAAFGSFSATYTAPPSVSVATTVNITATSVTDPTVTASQQATILPTGGGPNVVMLNVNGGPVPGQVYQNRAFTSIMLCNPGSTTCQTVDGILVDTGSYGLRILQSQIPLLALPAATDQLGNTLENCASWPDGSFLWGQVSSADIYIGQEGAGVNVQLISSTPSTVPDGCSNGAITNDNTPQLLGANGILGIGPEPTDCTLSGVNYCDGSSQPTPPNVYYACPSSGCTASASPVLVNALLQVSNPIPLFFDSNGAIIQFPAVSDPQASTTGTMTFGIGTESNNNLGGSATVFTLDANDNFTTTYNGQTLTNSYIDSGSNALYFPDTLPVCAVNTEFYCPPSSVSLSAINTGATQGSATINFTVDNANNLFSNYAQDSVFIGLAGPEGTFGSCSQGSGSCTFDWGLPFFYGRTVYTAIDGQIVSGAPSPPWWAY